MLNHTTISGLADEAESVRIGAAHSSAGLDDTSLASKASVSTGATCVVAVAVCWQHFGGCHMLYFHWNIKVGVQTTQTIHTFIHCMYILYIHTICILSTYYICTHYVCHLPVIARSTAPAPLVPSPRPEAVMLPTPAGHIQTMGLNLWDMENFSKCIWERTNRNQWDHTQYWRLVCMLLGIHERGLIDLICSLRLSKSACCRNNYHCCNTKFDNAWYKKKRRWCWDD